MNKCLAPLVLKHLTGLYPMFLVPDGAPPNVTARNLSATELLVEWEPLPEKYLHGVLVGYCINITSGKTNLTKILNIPPNATNHRIMGLEKYTRYVISIAAINDIGMGVYSDDVTVWTEEDGKVVCMSREQFLKFLNK